MDDNGGDNWDDNWDDNAEDGGDDEGGDEDADAASGEFEEGNKSQAAVQSNAHDIQGFTAAEGGRWPIAICGQFLTIC